MLILIKLFLKKYYFHCIILAGIFISSVYLQFSDILKKEEIKEPVKSVDTFVPKGFVLVAADIGNTADIINIIGAYGVVDLYSYSSSTRLPTTLVASAVKILSPVSEESSFMAMIPEKYVQNLLEHSGPFYAVIQNPDKQNTQIYKKKWKTSLVVIEERGLQE